MEEGLYARLAADAGIAALVVARIYPQVAPQTATTPYLLYQRISAVRPYHLTGVSGIANPRFQVSCVSLTYSEAKGLSRLVRQSLAGFTGTSGGYTIHGSFIESDRDYYDPPKGGTNVGFHRVVVDATFWHNET